MRRCNNIYYSVFLVLIMLVGASYRVDAQEFAVSTNALSWANLGTINAEASIGTGRHISFNAGITYNPWQFTSPTYVELMNKQKGAYLGVKYWPWHVYSEWWIGAKLQYKNYEQIGLLSPERLEGNALGAGLAAGYSLMIGERFNLDFGLGMWAGHNLTYKEHGGPKNFVFLDSVIVALVYLF